MKASDRSTIQLELTAEQRRQLRMLRTSPAMDACSTLEEIVQYIVASVCDGIRRPGSWERGCVAQMFGEWSCPLPPICSVCDFDLIDEDDPLQLQSKLCENCLLHSIDLWSEDQPESEALDEILTPALAAEPHHHQADDVRAARQLCWEAMGNRSDLPDYIQGLLRMKAEEDATEIGRALARELMQ